MKGISWVIVGDLELRNFSKRYVEQSSGLVNLFLILFDEYMNKLSKENLAQNHMPPIRVEGKIRYTRCADKFLVGVAGSYKDVKLLRHLLKDFLEKEQGFMSIFRIRHEVDNLKIIHLGSNYAEFLGYYIKVPSYSQLLASRDNSTSGLQDANAKNLQLSTRIPKLIVSKDVIKKWLIKKGFSNQEGKPKYVGEWIYLSDAKIISRFNNIILGLIMYYKMGENRRDLNESIYIIKYSLLHTLAAKHRISLKQVIKKYTLKKVNNKLGNVDKGKIVTFDEPKSLSAAYLDENYYLINYSPFIDSFLSELVFKR